MKTASTLSMIIIALFICSMPVLASDNDHCIAKQLEAHQQAEQQLLQGFATGNQKQSYKAAVDIAASETYLQVCGFSGDDPRMHGALIGENSTPESYAVAVFHKRLNELTRFQSDASKAFSEVNWNRIEGSIP